MKREYRQARLRQISGALAPFQDAKEVVCPAHGWLRAVREALGISLERVGQITRTSKQRVQRFEKAEAADRITLRNLRRMAEGMGCELVYAIVPKSGTFQQLAEERAREQAARRILSVEHSMALEDQASGGVEELIEEETKRILGKS